MTLQCLKNEIWVCYLTQNWRVKCILPLLIFPNFTFLFFQYNYIIYPKLAKKFGVSQIMCQPIKLLSNLSFKKSEHKTFHLHSQTSYNGRWRIWIHKNNIHSFILIMIATPSLLTIPSLITSKPSSHSRVQNNNTKLVVHGAITHSTFSNQTCINQLLSQNPVPVERNSRNNNGAFVKTCMAQRSHHLHLRTTSWFWWLRSSNKWMK